MALDRQELDPNRVRRHSGLIAQRVMNLQPAVRMIQAIAEYNKAWRSFPILRTTGMHRRGYSPQLRMAAFLSGNKTAAREALRYVMTCPGGIGNPFLHLRYGQVLLDAGEGDGGGLMNSCGAYMSEGSEIFAPRRCALPRISKDPCKTGRRWRFELTVRRGGCYAACGCNFF